MRIVQLANFVMPTSGGLRTALSALGAGYRALGHDPVLVIPGERWSERDTDHGWVITMPGVVVPGTGGYRVLLHRRPVLRLLDELAPDALEVSDRTTLRWTGRWAAQRGISAVMVSHESVSGLLTMAGLGATPARWLADRLNARTAASYDHVVCTTAWAAGEFRRIGVRNLRQVPLGVDLDLFHPGRHSAQVRARYARPEQALLVHCGRLSVEKRPDRSVTALRELRAAGVDAVLVMAGSGPLAHRIAAAAAGLPVRLTGFVAERAEVATLLATADVVLAPGPIETFGLTAVEALACGTPAVVDAASALGEVVGAGGVAVTGEDYATAVRSVLARPIGERRASARRRAEEFDWAAAVAGFLRVHSAVERVGA